MKLYVVNFKRGVAQSRLTIDLSTIDLVSKASSLLLSDNALNSFTNFSTEQLNLEGHEEVAVSKHPTH